MISSQPHILAYQEARRSLERGSFKEARVALDKALKAKPDFYQAWLLLGKLDYKTENFASSLKAIETAERYDPLQAEFRIIQTAMNARDFVKAINVANQMLENIPGHPRAIFTLAQIYKAQGHQEKSIETLKDGLEHSPANLILRHMLIEALEDTADVEGAIKAAQEIVNIQRSFESLSLLAGIYLRYGFNDKAIKMAEQLEGFYDRDNLKLSDIALVKGQALKIMGQREKGIEALRSALSHNPMNADAWWALADMKNYVFSKNDQSAMKTIIQNGDQTQKSIAAFSLAKSIELTEGIEAAMSVYEKANKMLPNIRFDANGYTQAVDRVIDGFSSKALSAQAHTIFGGAVPIFIIGMPRSGSTLIEQILASHAQIEGTIELPMLPRIKRKIHSYCARELKASYLDSLSKIGPQKLSQFGESYMKSTHMFREQSKPFFTDKLPANFENVGLIHKILPHAKIIDARRNPLDCGLSMYKQYFASGSHFSYDLKHIGAYYNGYLKLMDHWDTVLPGKVLKVQYEEMVTHTEGTVREILSFIGVEFDENCLKFYETQRAVRTASSEQVRQKIYSQSIGVWCSVDKELFDLKNSLGTSSLERFSKYF